MTDCLSHCVLLALLFIFAGARAAYAAPATDESLKRAKAHYKLGAEYHDKGAYDQAIAEYRAAYDLAPLPELIFNIGQAYRLKQDKRRAIEAYRRFLDLQPEGPLADEARAQVANLNSDGGLPAPQAQPLPPQPPPAQPAPRGGSGLRIAGIVTGAAGLVAIGLAVKYGLDASSASDRATALAREAQLGQSWASGTASRVNAAIDEGESAQRNMYIFYGVGGALVATGTVLYVLGARAGSERAQIVPITTPRAAGLALRGAF